jgi:prephenate dehydrogenase
MTRVGIIGVRGQYGSWLKKICEGMGFSVIGSEREGGLRNEEVVQKSDIVIFAVPIACMVEVIESCVPFSRPEQLWMDITSVKQEPVEAMLKSQAEVVGLHPMSAPPDGTLKGQVMVVCRERLDRWGKFLNEFLAATEATIRESTPAYHDRQMAVVQVLSHASSISMASTVRALKVEVKDTRRFTSPFYQVLWSAMSRLLAQNPELYADIQLHNPYTLEVLRAFEASVSEFRGIIERKDREAFLSLFANNASHFGQESLNEGYEFFAALIKHLARD